MFNIESLVRAFVVALSVSALAGCADDREPDVQDQVQDQTPEVKVEATDDVQTQGLTSVQYPYKVGVTTDSTTTRGGVYVAPGDLDGDAR